MTKKTFLYFSSLLCFTFLLGNMYAQVNQPKDYSSHPYWIGMMKDTNANYYETVKAFDGYWKGREKPQSENDKFENTGKAEVKSKNIPFSFEYRKFLLWQMQVKPYVQNDGSILYPYQRYLLRKNARSANPANNIK